jgi:alpha-N-dichloroacetyl-p-aminophenylserinol N-oxygenase
MDTVLVRNAEALHGTPQQAPATRDLLRRLATNWPRRAQVKRDELDASVSDEAKDDFIPELLPFRHHPLFVEAPAAVRRKILSCGWLAYNEKTIDIEAKIINPACLHIVHRDVPGLRDGASREIASQTLVDEAYHILLVNRANEITRERRDLVSVPIPECTLVKQMRACQETYRDNWQRMLIQLATAIVSEVFISDYLRLLSHETSIPSFNRLTVATHRRDELAHEPIFRVLAKFLYADLSKNERAFFMSVLPRPVRWFANLELDVWQTMLEHIGFSGSAALIRDCRDISEENLSALDYSGVVSLAEELGMLETQMGVDSFSCEGLLAGAAREAGSRS